MTRVVDVRDLFRVYPGPQGGVAALQGLTLTVEEGELCVVLGPSGSGKSTLLRVIAGFERPSAGSAHVAGVDVGALAGRRLASFRAAAIGYADQHYWRALAGELTAEELVAVPLGLAGQEQRERRARARSLLERVGLLDRATAYPGELSGGEQQRVALCAALAGSPRLLVADEPTGELDAQNADGVYRLLVELVRELRATALVVSHDPRSEAIADRLVHIRDGRVSEERRAERETIVVGRGGWLRIPEDKLLAARIGERAVVELGSDGVVLRPAEPTAAISAPAGEALTGRDGMAVEARQLTRRFGSETALDRLDATFGPGRLTVVTGPSGSGKSTLMHLLAGLDVPDEGHVLVDGVDLGVMTREERAAFRARSIAFVDQAPALCGFLTSRENVAIGLAVRGLDPADPETVDSALAAVGLADQADREIDRLSAGQRERVALARALAVRPAVLLADEPTARLDAATTLMLGRLLAAIATDYGTTVVCATHDPLLAGLAHEQLRLGSS
ncbi:MAG TPA: ATP-binding cassette domain-containing protein [Gaiellaceae bacterium]|jgi:ABC-type lipoprotein export system ATPase subunit